MISIFMTSAYQSAWPLYILFSSQMAKEDFLKFISHLFVSQHLIYVYPSIPVLFLQSVIISNNQFVNDLKDDTEFSQMWFSEYNCLYVCHEDLQTASSPTSPVFPSV